MFPEYEFGNELKPIKELSLYDVQCKLNSAGASGMYFYLLKFLDKPTITGLANSQNI